MGKDGDWLIDFHQRFDFADALRGCKLLEDLEPFLVEDPVRAEAFLEDIPKLRRQTTVPLAAGEEWGQRWDFNKLVENHDLDYVRATLPNVGGITEMQKDRGDLRDPFCRDRAAFHRADRGGGAGARARHISRAGVVRVQLPVAKNSVSAAIYAISRTASCGRTNGPAWASSWI